VAVGDFDDDGFDDIAMGAPQLVGTGWDAYVYVYYGDPALPSQIEADAPPRGSLVETDAADQVGS